MCGQCVLGHGKRPVLVQVLRRDIYWHLHFTDMEVGVPARRAGEKWNTTELSDWAEQAFSGAQRPGLGWRTVSGCRRYVRLDRAAEKWPTVAAPG